MKEAEILKKQVEKYLMKVFLESNFEEWDDTSTLTLKDVKKKTSIFILLTEDKIIIKMYLHPSEEQANKTRNGSVYGYTTYTYSLRARFIHYLYFFSTARKVRLKVKKIVNYFIDKDEYTEAKLAFDSLPTSYQRKTKLEQIENGQ